MVGTRSRLPCNAMDFKIHCRAEAHDVPIFTLNSLSVIALSSLAFLLLASSRGQICLTSWVLVTPLLATFSLKNTPS